jgi:hypothetical protein
MKKIVACGTALLPQTSGATPSSVYVNELSGNKGK